MTSRSFGTVTVTDKGNGILLMRMHGGNKKQSVFNPEFSNAVLEALDYVESFSGERCLVLTGTDRFFSAGLDLKFMGPNMEHVQVVAGWATKVYKRILLFNMPTVAAINGHTFGAGVFVSLCCDYRLMRKDCGKLCLPEAKIGLPFGVGWRDILRLKLLPNTLRTMGLTAKTYASNEALSDGIIDHEIDTNHNNDQFIEKCIEFAKGKTKHAKNRANYSRLKYDLYYVAVEAMNTIKTPSKL